MRSLPLARMITALSLLAVGGGARAHCDTLDGPVAAAVRQALEDGKPGPVLAWVPASREASIRDAYAHAVAARRAGREARSAADHAFLETVIRVHREGEGAPYTGVKPAGQLDPVLAAADRALQAGSIQDTERLLVDAVRDGLRRRYAALHARQPPGDDVAAGRAWVAAYVDYVHFVERVHQSAVTAGDAHEHAALPGAHEHAPSAGAGHEHAQHQHGS